VKITLNGEVYEYDGSKPKVSEALAIEEAYGRRYVEWQADMQAGGVKALCTLAWFIWQQHGRDMTVPDGQGGNRPVTVGDLLDDTFPLDLHEMLESIVKSGLEAEQAAAGDPTTPGAESAPDGTPTTGTDTPPSSRSTSGSARGKSGSSKSGTSKH